jgi:hypothetical protein
MKCTECQILHIGPMPILNVRFVVAVIDAVGGASTTDALSSPKEEEKQPWMP